MPFDVERRTQPSSPNSKLAAGGDCASRSQLELQMARICRIGRQMFSVADCVVQFKCHDGDYPAADAVLNAAEIFCLSLPHPTKELVVPDVQHIPSLSDHATTAGATNVRFYATYPLRDATGTIIGCVCLIDYASRTFSDDAMKMLADLAALVERELELQTMGTLQIALQKKNKSLRRRSLIDPMLKTWNRAAIMRILGIEADRCDKRGVSLSLIVVDLDFFKKINDNYGHPVGDVVLIKVAARLRSCLRQQDALGRYGGEEFLVVLPDASLEAATVVAERIRQSVAATPEIVGDLTLHLSISAGVACTQEFPTASTDELISRADAALYVAKDSGRNRVMQALPSNT